MEELKLGTVESKFADIIWESEIMRAAAGLEEVYHIYHVKEAMRTGIISK